MDTYGEDMNKVEDSLNSLEGKDYISENSIAFSGIFSRHNIKSKALCLRGKFNVLCPKTR